METDGIKNKVLKANLSLPEHGLVVFTWGNASEIDRKEGVVAIKPGGVEYAGMEKEHIVVLDLEGNIVQGDLKPSSDTKTHLEIYKNFPEVGGIVHVHSQWAVSWAQARKGIPAYGTTHADYFRGEIPCTRELTDDEIDMEYELNTGKVIVETFRKNNINPVAMPGVLVANHGPFAWGKDAAQAVHNAVVMEKCAMMAFYTGQINPGIQPVKQTLLDKHYSRKHGKDAYYGQGK